MHEEFRKIEDAQWLLVSNKGNIYNSKFNKPRKIRVNAGGHPIISYITTDNIPKTMPIINIMWRAFNGEIPDDMKVINKDGNKLNISLENLELEHIQYKKILKAREERRIERIKKANEKLNVRTVEETEAIISVDGEIWKTVRDSGEFVGWRISNFGRVHNNKKLKLRSISIGVNGYSMIGRRGETLVIHREVASLFISPPPSDKHTVNHKDGNRRNNHVSNLEWVTHKDNIRHAHDTKLSGTTQRYATANQGKRMRKFTASDIQTIMQLIETTPINTIATQFNVNRTTINRILSNNGYKDKKVALLQDKSPYNKPLCLNISSELRNKLLVISEKIEQPLTSIFRHALIEFVNKYDKQD